MVAQRPPEPLELPVEGFPPSEEMVTRWFLHRWGRLPGAEEIGRILNAMALREASPPVPEPLDGIPIPGADLAGTTPRGS
jgi:hypothetical protein